MIINRTALIIGGIVGFIVFLDLLFLNLRILFAPKETVFPQPIVSEQNSTRTSPLSTITNADVCPFACISLINNKLSLSSSPTPASAPAPATPTAAPQTTASPQQTTTSESNVKEFFIPLGSGSTTSTSWVTISGIEAQVNSANYSGISSVSFEASLRVPTGNGILYARLINLSDDNPLSETEVSVQGSTGQLVSKNFTLVSGTKRYGVQVKSTLGFAGFLDLARIKITLQ